MNRRIISAICKAKQAINYYKTQRPLHMHNEHYHYRYS